MQLKMDKSKVSIVRAFNYDYAEIYAGIEGGIELICDLGKLIQPGCKVFVKINHLSPASPADRGIVTHPVFAEAVLTLLKKTGADISVGDDVDSDPRDGFRVSGFSQMCERIGVRLINLRETGFTETVCNGHTLKKAYLSKTALNADVIVNLPKFKTHSLCIFTGGVKNLYGTIPGGLRRKFHSEYINPDDFNQVLVDIFSMVKPQLTIMDGIIAMEGEGPAAGTLRKLGVILASHDAVALDAVATKIIGLEPKDIGTTQYAYNRGLGIGDLQNIEIIGSRIEDVNAHGFVYPANTRHTLTTRLPKYLSDLIYYRPSIKLSVIKRNCTGCAECKKACPSGAISLRGEKAIINQDICIQCMCCHEVCRYYAIASKRSFVGNVIHFLSNALLKLMAK